MENSINPKQILQDQIEAKVGDLISFSRDEKDLPQQVEIVDVQPPSKYASDPNEVILYLRNTTTKKMLILSSSRVFPSVKKNLEIVKSYARIYARLEERHQIDAEQFSSILGDS